MDGKSLLRLSELLKTKDEDKDSRDVSQSDRSSSVTVV